MAGYCGYSMSNNAIDAYKRGLLPASKIKGVPVVLIKEFCRPEEWHHTSKRFNGTNFYDPKYVRSTFGLEQCDEYMPNPEAIKALNNYSYLRKRTEVYAKCRVEWLEWVGTKRHPRANKKVADGCMVEIKGQTATVTLSDGKVLKKRLSANGFNFEQLSNLAS